MFKSIFLSLIFTLVSSCVFVSFLVLCSFEVDAYFFSLLHIKFLKLVFFTFCMHNLKRSLRGGKISATRKILKIDKLNGFTLILSKYLKVLKSRALVKHQVN